MLILVNKLEGTFARSLIVCDVPVDGFSGSAHCGDRLSVIDAGQKLSSTAQGYECLSRVLAMLFVSVMADLVGRKPAFVMGLSCTALSMLLFVVASQSPAAVATWLFIFGQALQGAYPAELLGAPVAAVATWLFIFGQALQGAYPAELLGDVVVTDIGNQPGASLIVIGSINQGTSINYMEVLDCRFVWIAAAVVNATPLVLAVALFRETKPDFGGEQAGSIVEGVKREVAEYTPLLLNSRLLRMNLLWLSLFAVMTVCDSLDFSFVTARHSFEQARAVCWFFLMPPVGVLCIGVVPMLSRTFGEKRIFVAICYLVLAMDSLMMPFYPASPWVVFAHKYAFCVFSGFGALGYAIDSRWFDQRVTSKYLSMKNLSYYAVGMLANPLYGSLFDAKAKTYFASFLPYLLKIICRCAQVALMLGVCWDMGAEGGLSSVLDRIERENSEARAKDQQGGAAEKKED